MAAQIRIKATGKGAKPKPPINFFFFFPREINVILNKLKRENKSDLK